LRFWRDGMGLEQFFDLTFDGDWPTLFGATDNRLRSVFLGDPASPEVGLVELVDFDDGRPEGSRVDGPAPGFFLLSFEREVEPVLQQLAAAGFNDGVRRITQTVGDGRTVDMAVITAPDGVLVELVGLPQ
jgi:glyoxylase I family protein